MKMLFSWAVLFGVFYSAITVGAAPAEKKVVFAVQEGFRGPIIFEIDPANDALPSISGDEVIYKIPASGIITVKSMDLSNGSLWRNYFVKYPDGGVVIAYGDGDELDQSQDYLFSLGEQSDRGKSTVAFVVATADQRQRLQAAPLFDFREYIPAWEKLPDHGPCKKPTKTPHRAATVAAPAAHEPRH